MFHQTIKQLRIQHRLTLRDFCSQAGLDPSHWSKVERRVAPPPSNKRLLDRISDLFSLDSTEKGKLLASLSFPRDECSDEGILTKALQAFFPFRRGQQLSPAETQNLAEDILRLHRPDGGTPKAHP
jgi:transcriptional regulator with XRE-family HTH domain